MRFERGVREIVLRCDGRPPVFAPVVFRADLNLRAHLPRPVFVELGLQVGMEAVALIKSTSVMIITREGGIAGL